METKPKKGDIIFTHKDGNLLEMEVEDKNTLNLLSVEYPSDKDCKHNNGYFPEQFLGSRIIFHRCNECGKILFHTDLNERHSFSNVQGQDNA